ncbi:hypothetical protein Tco_1416781, partial [Tanacetum coccineum]
YKDKKIGEPVLDEYITVTRKNYISDNDGGKIVEKSFHELKVTFLVKIRDNAFSRTNGEDAVEHFKKILEVVGPLSNTTMNVWVRLQKLFEKFYPPSRTNMKTKAYEDEVSWDQTNNEFENWLASKFETYVTMDHDTMYALWKYWRIEGNEKVKNDNEPCVDKEEGSDEENEIAEIFRIETDIFDYESPLCKVFDEFNYLFQIDPDVLTKDIPGFKTYEE